MVKICMRAKQIKQKFANVMNLISFPVDLFISLSQCLPHLYSFATFFFSDLIMQLSICHANLIGLLPNVANKVESWL